MVTLDFIYDSNIKLLQKFAFYFNIDFSELMNYFLSANPDTMTPYKIISKFKVDLKKFDSSKIEIMCYHMTTTTEEDIQSFKNKGLLDLKRVLQENTPLSIFLKNYGISIDVDNHILKVKNKEYPILQSSETCDFCYIGKDTICTDYFRCDIYKSIAKLATKLYYYNATVESFINAQSTKKMQQYSTISRCPEILSTLDEIISNIRGNTVNLCNDWINRNTNCYLISYPSKLSDMETFAPISMESKYTEIKDCLNYCGYTYSDYNDLEVCQNFYDNYYLINKFISIYFYNSEEYGSLLPNMTVPPEKLIINRIENRQF